VKARKKLKTKIKVNRISGSLVIYIQNCNIEDQAAVARDFAAAAALAGRLLRYQGAGHSIGLHTRDDQRALELGLTLPVSRVIVNQAHCFATGGSFDNALPFSLSMGCGTWGRNSISDNLNYRHFLNITRVVRPLAPERIREPTEEELFGAYLRKHPRKSRRRTGS